MKYLISCLLIAISVLDVKADVDPNFNIFLCFGQSNMEGAMPPEPVDVEFVDERFQTLACEDFNELGRTMGQWYTAYPPIVRENTYIGIADYFGRTMVAALPADYRVGVVDVAVGGVGITAFMPESAMDWAWIMNNTYNNDPYTRLVQMARVAQKSGVIKGILLHQGEANHGQEDWPQYVKTVYERLLSDLGLNAAEVPLLVGELISASEGGVFSDHNNVIATVPTVIPTAHIISSEGCTPSPDYMHFALSGYRLMGKRYALKMLSLLGFPTYIDANYQLPQNLHRLYKATCLNTYADISLKPNNSYIIDVTACFEDGHTEDVTADAVIRTYGEGVQINGNQLTAVSEESTLVTISYTDFIGETVSTSFYVNKSDSPETIIKANDYFREYGEPNPVFDYVTEGNDVHGIPDFYCEATELSPVGTYSIRISRGSITDENVTFVDGTLTITKAQLTVKAEDCSREEGQENPDFKVIYNGFKNEDTEDVLTRKPTVITMATQNSEPGYYDIEVYGAEAQNYDLVYVKGVLTVTEKEKVDFTIDGTTYQGSNTSKTAIVTSVDTNLVSLEIPASVRNDGITYQVIGIDDHAFDGCNLAALVWDVEAILPDDVLINADVGSNFILYVKSVSYAPSSVLNVVVNGIAQSIVLSDDGGWFYCPQAFTAQRISYTHNYSMETGYIERGWETLVLPYDVQTIVHSTSGEIVPYSIDRTDSTLKLFWLANFSENGFRLTSAIEANEPYIIAMPNSGNYQDEYNLAGDVTFYAENVVVPKTPMFSGLFVPAYSTIEKSSTVYALNVNNRYMNYTGGYESGSCFISGLRDVRPFEAYFSGSYSSDIIEIIIDKASLDINKVLFSPNEDRQMGIYSLCGQLIASTTLCDFEKVWNSLSKGIYIVNGKKRIK